jgi:O-antigen/teichoic acid export membrane protein
VAVTTALGKISSFLAQLVLGWLLSEDDYALYATAIAISSLVSVLYDGGMAKILIQRGHEYTSLARAILSISLVFNGLAATVLIAISLIATYYYQSTTLALLLGLIGLSTILLVFYQFQAAFLSCKSCA